MYELIDMHTGAVIYRTHSHAAAWLILTRCSWLALVY